MSEDDVGEYEAIATNSCGQAATRFLLVVDEGPEEHFPPRQNKTSQHYNITVFSYYLLHNRFLSQLRNQELKASTNLLLHTKISASPCVAVNWYRNGCKLRPSSSVHKHFDKDGNATLAMVDNEGGVDGNYTCVAYNEGGENSISVQVTKAKQGEEDRSVKKLLNILELR